MNLSQTPSSPAAISTKRKVGFREALTLRLSAMLPVVLVEIVIAAILVATFVMGIWTFHRVDMACALDVMVGGAIAILMITFYAIDVAVRRSVYERSRS